MSTPTPLLSIITGGGTGIGAALAQHLVSLNHPVLIVGRRLAPLLATATSTATATSSHSSGGDLIRHVAADVSTPEGRRSVLDAILPDEKVRNIIHNAGTLEPTGPLMDVDLESWRGAMAVNVEAPLFLTRVLLPKLSTDGGMARILHVSSGAAHRNYQGWGSYCVSKAALHMMYRLLKEELKPMGVSVGSVRPGVVDTPMQDSVRGLDRSVFPAIDKFMTLKETGGLMDPKDVARFMTWLLYETSEEEFSREEWDIRDEMLRERWDASDQCT